MLVYKYFNEWLQCHFGENGSNLVSVNGSIGNVGRVAACAPVGVAWPGRPGLLGAVATPHQSSPVQSLTSDHKYGNFRMLTTCLRKMNPFVSNHALFIGRVKTKREVFVFTKPMKGYVQRLFDNDTKNRKKWGFVESLRSSYTGLYLQRKGIRCCRADKGGPTSARRARNLLIRYAPQRVTLTRHEDSV